MKFRGAVRIGMKGQEQPADFVVGLKQVYGDEGATVMLVVMGLAKGGQLDSDGRIGVGARVIRVNRRKVAGLHGEVISRLLAHAKEVVFLAPPVLPRAPPPTINGQPVVTLGGEVMVLRRAPPPTINGRPVAMIGHMGDTEVTVPADVEHIDHVAVHTAGSTPSHGGAAVGGPTPHSGNASSAGTGSGTDLGLVGKLGRLFSKKRSSS